MYLEPYLKACADFILIAVGSLLLMGVTIAITVSIGRRIVYLFKVKPNKCPGCDSIMVSDILSKKYGDWCPNENCDFNPKYPSEKYPGKG